MLSRPCPACENGYAAALAKCPHCNAANPAPQQDAELLATLDAAVGEDVRAKRSRSHRLRVATLVLFALSLPTVMPSLLVIWLMSKRWGRVDFVLIGIDLLIIVLAASQSRLLFIPAVISACAAAAVSVLRYRTEKVGIALGYSGNVITPAMLGGALVLGSVVYLGSSSGLRPHINHLFPPELGGAELTDALIGAEVRVPPAEIEWERAILCSEERCSPEGPAPRLRAAALLARADELLGSTVSLVGAPAPTITLQRDAIDYRTSADGAPQRDRSARVHAMIPGTNARLWIASTAGSPTTASPTGRLVYVENDRDVARRYAAAAPAGDPLPLLALTIVSGLEPDLGALERWAPLSGDRDRAYVAIPASVDRIESARGVVRDRVAMRARLSAASRGAIPDTVTVVAIGLEAPPEQESPFRGSMIIAYLALLLGMIATAGALFFAWREP